jgi:hypothetical protein
MACTSGEGRDHRKKRRRRLAWNGIDVEGRGSLRIELFGRAVRRQGIYFATSPDLLIWTVCRDMPALQPDPRWYDNTATGRWDCIWVVKTAEGRYTGYLTARPWSGDSGLTYESVGKVVSADGLHFSAARPPLFVWNGLPRMNVFEVGAVERIHGRYYMIIAMAEEELGNRQLWRQNMGNTGMYCFTSDSLDGPFALQKENPRLLVSKDRMTYFARFYRCGEQTLLSHHSIERCGYAKKRAGVWMAPLKSAKPDDNGILRLGYYEGNEALKGEAIELTRDHAVRISADRGPGLRYGRLALHIRHIDLGKILMWGRRLIRMRG